MTSEFIRAARSFGARVRMTRADHLSGTDRVAEVASAENAEIVVNIQGDEPLIDPAAIDAAILPLVHEPDVVMGTLKKRIEDPREITDPNVVKVVTDHAGDAIYFSRCPIPYLREDTAALAPRAYFKHIGLYVYRRDFLLGYSALPVGPLEQAERLEQLRAMENGYRIRVVETEYESLGVDTPEDLERVSRLVRSNFVARDERRMAKYIFVTGGVVSSLGKGIAAASIGCLLESRGLKVTCQKFDPYLNVDPGTMSPFQHGEVFVTDDGAETDLDLGHYERFTHARLTQSNNLTSGRIYETDHRPRAPRRLSGQDRAGDSARHQRDQGRHEARGAGRGRGDRRDRRHRGRYRIAAVPGSHPPDAPRAGPRQLPLRARHAGAVDRRRAGTEDQADPAQRQGTARHRYPARYPDLPLGALHLRRR